MLEPELVSRRDRFEAGVGDLAVRHAHDGAVERADAGRAQADVIDRAGDLTHLQKIAGGDRLIEDERRAGDDVLERLLRRKRHGDAADAEPGQCGCRIDAEMAQRRQDSGKDDQEVDHPAQRHAAAIAPPTAGPQTSG